MNSKNCIIDSDLTPVWRSFFQNVFLFLGCALLVWFAFKGSIDFSAAFSALLTAYILFSFVFKTKKRQQVWLEDNQVIASNYLSLSHLDKIVLAILAMMSVASNGWLISDHPFIALAFVGYQLCAFYFVYYTLHRKPTFAFSTHSQTAFFKRGNGQCLLVARFDVYTLAEKKAFIGTIELNDDDVDSCLNTLAKHMSIVTGTTKVKLDWQSSCKFALLGFAGCYTYLFLLPGAINAAFPVGYYWNSKLRKTVYRDDFLSNFGVFFFMLLAAPLCFICGAWIYEFYLDLKDQQRNAVALSNDAIFLFPSANSKTEAVKLPIADVQYLIWPKGYGYGKENDNDNDNDNDNQGKLIIDDNVKLIDRNGELISLSTWAWAAHSIINHLVKLGVPVRLK